MKAEIVHGYNRYTNGCRCGVCTVAKRERQRDYRAEKRAARDQATVSGRRHTPVGGIKHGYTGYVEHFCRCEVCRQAASAQWRSQYLRRKGARRYASAVPALASPG